MSNFISRFFPGKFLKPAAFAALALLVLAGSYFRVAETYELQTYDWRCKMRVPRPISPDIVLVDIWNDTLDVLGRWPFDRENHAYLINALKHYNAKAIVFDIIFAEPSSDFDHDTSVSETDELVSYAAREANNVYFGFAFSNISRTSEGFASESIDSPLIEPYQKSAKGIGFLNIIPDIDGKRRRTLPFVDYQNKRHFQMSFQVALDLLNIKPEEIGVVPGKRLVLPGYGSIPLDDEGYFMINFAQTWTKAFKHISYIDAISAHQRELNGEKTSFDPKSIENKVCIIGLTSLGSHDTNPTPLESTYPMVGSYANILNGILQKDFIQRTGRLWNLMILVIIGCLIVLFSSRTKPLMSLLSTIAVMVVFIALNIFLFWQWGLWVDLFYPVLIGVLIYAGVTLLRTMREMRKRELIEGELKVASQIQKSFLPESLPDTPGIEIAVFMRPAKAVGGDLYSFLKFGEKKLGVMVGDVSGKGTPAALFMAKTVSEFKFSARDLTDPAQALGALNHSIASESTGGLFVTVGYAIFDLESKSLLFSNGGHLPTVCVGSEEQTELMSGDGGMPIGVIDGAEFSNFSRVVSSGDCFAFYTDGISEARNKKKDEYGVERLQQIMVQHCRNSPKEILDKTIEDLEHFIGKADQHDDMTLIIVKVN